MQTGIQLDVLSREIVKPSSTGPNHPVTHTLSFFDQIQPPIYIPIIYLYANTDAEKIDVNKSNALKTSLSAVLSLYYPLAGRSSSDNCSVNCNDEGVMFLEARMRCNISQVLNYSTLQEEAISKLIPDGLHYKYSGLSSPLVVQLTYFDCGGIAISVCISHSIMDMSSMSYFFNHWAALARNSGDPQAMVTPEFNLGKLFPPIQLPALNPPGVQFEDIKCASRTIVFDLMNLAKLKSLVKTTLVENPTRLEVVTALVLKCAVSASAGARSSLDLVKRVTVTMNADLRSRVCPPFSKATMGNFVGAPSVSITKEKMSELKWVEIVGEIRNEKNNFFNMCAEDSSAETLLNVELEARKFLEEGQDPHRYMCSSWCGFPFYEADFGWGKPAWVTHATIAFPNTFHLMDTRDGGIEVVVNLEEQQMAIFERDEELLQFSTVKS